jgi:dATP pyrophosphohydrolase
MSARTTQVEIIVFKIIENEIRFLLLKRNERKGDFWQPVTGGVEGEESLLQTVKRELQEETGIKEYSRIIDNVHYFEFNSEGYSLLKEHVFGVEVPPDTKIELSSEHTEMRWCLLDESLALLKYDSNRTAFKKLSSLLTISK